MCAAAAPKTWTSVTAADILELPETWHQQTVPAQLQYVPDNITPPQKLLDIIMWSLERDTAEDWRLRKDESRTTGSKQPLSASYADSQLSTATNDASKASHGVPTSSAPVTNGEGLTAQVEPSAKPATAHTQTSSRSDFLSAALHKLGALRSSTASDSAVSVAREIEDPSKECTSCFDDVPVKNLVRLSCTHFYCKSCLASLIMSAIQSESEHTTYLCGTDG